MITQRDLQEAIAECQGVRNPNASTAIKLAAFLTIQRELFNEPITYSFAEEPPKNEFNDGGTDSLGDYGESDFLQAVRGKDPAQVCAVIDELMDTLKVVNVRLYTSVMRKIK